jgi:hypothetical protein
MKLWKRNREFETEIAFLTTDMETVFLNIIVESNGELAQVGKCIAVSCNQDYIKWLILNREQLSTRLILDTWFSRKHRNELFEYRNTLMESLQ